MGCKHKHTDQFVSFIDALRAFKMTHIYRAITFLCFSGIIHFCRPNEITRAWWRSVSRHYLNYSETTQLLHSMEEEFSSFIRVYSLGKSVTQREMWAINLREDVHEDRPIGMPQLKVSANIHGDESVGRSLVLMLAVDLTRRYLAGNKTAVYLLTNADIHLIPSLNPDGFEKTLQDYKMYGGHGICEPFFDVVGHQNARKKNLNENFPDPFDEKVDSNEMERETKNIVRHLHNHDFVLGLTLKGGALVAAYGFMSNSLKHSRCVLGSNYDPSETPDEEYFEWISKLYADNHKTMGTGPQCATSSKAQFPLGISNGAASSYLASYGTMSDFIYLNSNCFEITAFVSCCKFPSASSLHKEWHNNVRAIYQFLLAGSFVGIKGVLTDEQGQPVKNARVAVEGNSHHVFTNSRGEYWRPLTKGSYRYSIVGSSTQSLMEFGHVEDLPDPENEVSETVVTENRAFISASVEMIVQNLTCALVLLFLVNHLE
ncbi:Carboxypeptidase D [Orchesella cincta]|uniref:Carboxypeptidase D n=1 Tax=Orchesella cincta TaxID=48709 RepID=A0A1D2MHA9_ORCCI|nr:Carboxypeptidase D [Orchesella cincta]